MRTSVKYLTVLVVGTCIAVGLCVLTFPRPTPALVLGFALMGAEAGVLLLCGEISTPVSRIVATSLIFGLVVGSSYLLLNLHSLGKALPTNNALLFVVGFVALAIGAGVGSIPKID